MRWATREASVVVLPVVARQFRVLSGTVDVFSRGRQPRGPPCVDFSWAIIAALSSGFRSRQGLVLENLALRQQLATEVQKQRPVKGPTNRLLLWVSTPRVLAVAPTLSFADVSGPTKPGARASYQPSRATAAASLRDTGVKPVLWRAPVRRTAGAGLREGVPMSRSRRLRRAVRLHVKLKPRVPPVFLGQAAPLHVPQRRRPGDRPAPAA